MIDHIYLPVSALERHRANFTRSCLSRLAYRSLRLRYKFDVCTVSRSIAIPALADRFGDVAEVLYVTVRRSVDAVSAIRRQDERGSYFQQGTERFGPNGVPTTSRQTSATRTDTSSRLPISLGSTNKRYEPSTHLRPHRPAKDKEPIMKRLDNKVVIVTGGSKGIGAGIAKTFGSEGAAVIVNYARDQAGAERVVREITGKGGRAIAGAAATLGAEVRHATPRRGSPKSLRPPGCAREQRRRLLVCALRAVQRAGISPSVRHECAGHIFAMIEAVLPAFGAEGGIIINIGSTASIAAYPDPFDLRGVKERCQWLDARTLKRVRPQKNPR